VILRLPICFLLVFWITSAIADTELSKADKIKAAYLFNFTKYIRWPDSHFDNAAQDIHMCSAAPEVFNTFLSELVAGKTVNDNRSIIVFDDYRNVSVRCDLIFVKVLNDLDENSVHNNRNGLIIGDDESLMANGASIVFYIEDDHVKFEVNLGSLENQGYTLSSQLLKLARLNKSESTTL
jgi:hypothetical protein